MGQTLYRTPLRLLGCLLLALSLTACQSQQSLVRGPLEPAKSPNDQRAYRYATLDNGLRVLLVSDPETDKAAASLVVFRGSYHEPEGRHGLAHFLEHMLFIGTEKYPEVDGYQNFIDQHGGRSNAYTALDHTNYFFDIGTDHFREGLDRFAQFFISPLFAAEYVDREKNAVDSEFQMQRKDDGWRGYSVFKQALNPEHPGANFTIGNLDTLGADSRPALIQWFKENYSADQMALVAISNEDLDTMAEWIEPLFEQVPNRNIGAAPQAEPLFRSTDLPATLRFTALKNEHRVSYNFPVPNAEAYYREKPLLYIANLLGHEGRGSLQQVLKARGWIESLRAGSEKQDSNTTILSVDLQLTDAGRQNLPAITDALFSYIQLAAREGVQRWRYEEQARMLELAFRYQEKQSATHLVYTLTPKLADYPPADVLRAPYVMDRFDPALIGDYFTYLRPDNVLIQVSSPEETGAQREPWFDVTYDLTRAPVDRTTADLALALPEPNAFVPEDLALRPDDPAGPALSVREPGLELWLDRDTTFGTPRANLYLLLGVTGGLESRADIVHATLYARLVTDALNEIAYPAYLAGLGYRISVESAGFEIALYGYEDKQPLLLQTILEQFAGLTLDPERVAIMRAELERDWRNFQRERPYTQTLNALGNLLLTGSWPPELLADSLAQVTPASLQAWREGRLQQLSIQGLMHGNLAQSDVQALAGTLKQSLPLADFPLERADVFVVDRALRHELDIDHNDAAILIYVQDDGTAFEDRAFSALADQLMGSAYFTELRTNQQLGYVVGVSNRTYQNRAGIGFVVQSPVADPDTLLQRTLNFLEGYLPTLEAMSEDDYARYQNGLITRLTEQDKNLAERSARLWSDLRLGNTRFDTRERLAEAVAGISQAQAVAFIAALPERIRQEGIIVFNRGQFQAGPEIGQRIQNIGAFKQPTIELPPVPVDRAAVTPAAPSRSAG